MAAPHPYPNLQNNEFYLELVTPIAPDDSEMWKYIDYQLEHVWQKRTAHPIRRWTRMTWPRPEGAVLASQLIFRTEHFVEKVLMCCSSGSMNDVHALLVCSKVNRFFNQIIKTSETLKIALFCRKWLEGPPQGLRVLNPLCFDWGWAIEDKPIYGLPGKTYGISLDASCVGATATFREDGGVTLNLPASHSAVKMPPDYVLSQPLDEAVIRRCLSRRGRFLVQMPPDSSPSGVLSSHQGRADASSDSAGSTSLFTAPHLNAQDARLTDPSPCRHKRCSRCL